MKLGWVRQVFELSEVELTEFHCNLNHNARVQLAFIPTDRLISLVSGKTSNGYMSVAASYNWIIYLIILAAVQSAMPEFRARLESRLRTPEQGADTVIWLALAQKAISRENGLFYQGKPSLTYSPTDTSFHVCLTYSATDTSFHVCLTYSPTATSFHVCLTYSPTDTSFHVCLTYSPTYTSFHVCLTYSPTDTSFHVCLTYSPTATSFHVCLTYSPTDTSFHVCLKLFWFRTGSSTVLLNVPISGGCFETPRTSMRFIINSQLT